jgi:hypothetical protein
LWDSHLRLSQTPIRTSKQIGKLNHQSDWDSNPRTGTGTGTQTLFCQHTPAISLTGKWNIKLKTKCQTNTLPSAPHDEGFKLFKGWTFQGLGEQISLSSGGLHPKELMNLASCGLDLGISIIAHKVINMEPRIVPLVHPYIGNGCRE